MFIYISNSAVGSLGEIHRGYGTGAPTPSLVACIGWLKFRLNDVSYPSDPLSEFFLHIT